MKMGMTRIVGAVLALSLLLTAAPRAVVAQSGCCVCAGSDCSPNPQCANNFLNSGQCDALCVAQGAACLRTAFQPGETCETGCAGTAPTATITPTSTLTPTVTKTRTPSATATIQTPTTTATPTATVTVTQTSTTTETATPAETATVTATATVTSTVTLTPTTTQTPTAIATAPSDACVFNWVPSHLKIHDVVFTLSATGPAGLVPAPASGKRHYIVGLHYDATAATVVTLSAGGSTLDAATLTTTNPHALTSYSMDVPGCAPLDAAISVAQTNGSAATTVSLRYVDAP